MRADQLRAGRLRQVLTLQRRTVATDAEGSPSEGWTTVGTIRAEVQAIGGQELVRAAQMEVKLSHDVTARYRSDLGQASSTAAATAGHNMRLLWGARVLDIQLVEDPDGRRRRLQLLCLEHQA